MATPVSGNRSTPVARFNTYEVSNNKIKAEIQSAQRTQDDLRPRTSWPPRPTRNSDEDGDLNLSASLGRPLPSERPERADSLDNDRDLDTTNLDRTLSFNSLSTLQRAEEAARLSQYRDSPVSACMTDRVPLDIKSDIHNPCPPLSVCKHKQKRKDEKRFLKKQKAQLKQTETTPTSDVASQRGSDGAKSPHRAVSDPSYKRTKEFASNMIKRLTINKSARLMHRPKSSPAEVPHIDDFDSKARLHNYLSESLPETVSIEQPPAEIAELPGSLPPYTLYDGPINQASHGGPSSHLHDSATVPLQRATSVPPSENAPKMMRCDNCQFGIKHEDLYLQCLTCNQGDRIICNACDASGFSCRHQLLRKRRNFLQEVDGVYRGHSSRSPSHSRHHESRRSTLDRSRPAVPANSHNVELEHTAPPSRKSDAVKKALESKELELQRREHDLQHRVREAELREREGLLRVREAEVTAKAKETDNKSNTDFMRSCMEMAVSLGAQFANMSRTPSTASTAPPSPVAPRGVQSSDPYFLGSSVQPATTSLGTDEDAFRSHGATKRKAGGNGDVGRSSSGSGSNRQAPRTPAGRPWDDGNGDEGEEASGTPKKPRHEADSAADNSTLYACHYCKYDPSRYSDRNMQEKGYRSCSSGYWPDISRLKQHLYRVHWRGKYCGQCYTVFKTDEELNEHRQWLTCEPKQCPFPEKFDMDVHAEIKKKRPQQSAKDVWYLLYDILFPETPRPATPYADRTNEQQAPSPSAFTAEPNRQALEQLFEARLADTNQEWMTTEMRTFLREQLRESMADLVRNMQLCNNSAPVSTPPQRSPGGPSRPRLVIPEQSISSVSTSPQPISALSATSAHSTSSARWHHFPNHNRNRSFSRPLPSRNSPASFHAPDERLMPESALTSAVDTTPSEYIFNVTTPPDPENDSWGPGSDSWEQGDELGLALSTDGFSFPFNGNTAATTALAYQEGVSTLVASQFQPVKLQSLEEPETGVTIPTQLKAKLPSEASIDSGYGSMHSKGSRFAPAQIAMPVAAKGGWAPPLAGPNVAESDHEAIAMMNDLPVPDSQINYGALDVSFAEFTAGGGWDVSGNF